MITIGEICRSLEQMVPAALQEGYDNSGLQTGTLDRSATGVLLSVDVNEEVVEEAAGLGFNLIITHHPLIFTPLKRVSDGCPVQRTVVSAIKNDVTIYTLHTNLDSIYGGVSFKMAEKLQMTGCEVLSPLPRKLVKLVTFVPHNDIERVSEALFAAGAGHIGDYDSCSYQLSGEGTFRGGDNTNPHVGMRGELHREPEIRFETILPEYLASAVVRALKEAHPYEEPAYDIYPLLNEWDRAGLGAVGMLPQETTPEEFLKLLKETFGTPMLRYTTPAAKMIQRVALCGGVGVSLLRAAISQGADAFVTADIKYHQFAEAEGRVLLIDAGHWETERYSMEIVDGLLKEKFPNFARRFSGVRTNPVNYY